MAARAIRTSFQDFLGRPPYASELERWQGKTRHAFATSLFGSEEFWQHWVREQLFYLMLIDNFRPTAEVIGELPELLATHVATPREALHRIALTSSFDLRNPGADTFVTVVMEQFLGRTVQSHRGELDGGKAAYDGRQARFLGQAARSQADVLRIAIEDRDATRHLLEREYRRLLHRELDRKDLRGWVTEVHKKPLRFLEVLRQWYLSEAYDRRLESPIPKSNRLFVRGLFVDLTGTLPDEGEAEALRSALDGLSEPKPLRAVVARALIRSGRVRLPGQAEMGAESDREQWVQGMFGRLLGREADDDERVAFLEALNQTGGDPGTVVLALASSREYQEY